MIEVVEISNEIKAKVFAQYLGQRVFAPKYGYGKLIQIGGYSDSDLGCVIMLEPYGVYHGINWSLLLRPLSEITDEDAIEVGMKLGKHCVKDFEIVQIFQYRPRSIEIEYRYKVEPELALKDGYAYSAVGFSLNGYNLNIAQYQYLQSKGYDLPHYLLGGKTLKEAGLAIYQND